MLLPKTPPQHPGTLLSWKTNFFHSNKKAKQLQYFYQAQLGKIGGLCIWVLWVILWVDRIFKSNDSVSNIHWHFQQKNQLKCQTKQKQVFSFFYKDSFKKGFWLFFLRNCFGSAMLNQDSCLTFLIIAKLGYFIQCASVKNTNLSFIELLILLN